MNNDFLFKRLEYINQRELCIFNDITNVNCSEKCEAAFVVVCDQEGSLNARLKAEAGKTNAFDRYPYLLESEKPHQ